jgi:hypothetical protein
VVNILYFGLYDVITRLHERKFLGYFLVFIQKKNEGEDSGVEDGILLRSSVRDLDRNYVLEQR